MAQRRSPNSRKSTAKSPTKSPTKSKAKSRVKSKSTAARPKAKTAKAAAPRTTARTKAKTKGMTTARAKKAASTSTKSTPKAARPVARRTARAVQGRKPGGLTQRSAPTSKAGKVGVETRPQDMDAGGRGPGFVYEEQSRQSSDERFSPGNYEPGQVGEAKMSPRPRGVAYRGGGSETETPADTNPRVATDGSAREEQGASRDYGKAE